MSKNCYSILVEDNETDDESVCFSEIEVESFDIEPIDRIEKCVILKNRIIYSYIDNIDYMNEVSYFEEILELHQFIVDSEKNRKQVDISIRKRLGSLIEIVGKAFLESKMMHDGELDHVILEDNIFYQDIVYRLFYDENGKWIYPLHYYINSRSEKVPTLKSHVRLHFISLLKKAVFNLCIKRDIHLFYRYIRDYSINL